MSRAKTAKNVTTIPATISRFTAAPINEQRKRRTAGYARVSTDSDEQFTSYEAQVDITPVTSKAVTIGNLLMSTPMKVYRVPTPKSVRALREW